MPAFRVLTVDNEATARRQLRSLPELDPECELIGERANAAEAIRADVRLRKMDAFEVVRGVGLSARFHE